MGKKDFEHLEVDGITKLAKAMDKHITEFNDYVDKMESITTTLLGTWKGKGKNEFETQYELLKGQLGDISDELYDIYGGLVDAGAAYIDADEQVAKQISAYGIDTSQ